MDAGERHGGRPRSRTVLVIVAVLALMWATSGSGCQPDADPPVQFEVDITAVSDPTPNLNDLYRIEWTYSPAERFADQFVEVQGITIEGRVASTFFGCAPDEFVPPGTVQNDCDPGLDSAPCDGQVFTNTCRHFTRQFFGPVIFTITAQDAETGAWKREAVTLRIPDSHFRVGTITQSNAGYPDLGFAGNVPKQIDFLKYFAVFNGDRAGNVAVRDLRTPPFDNALVGGFDTTRTFFGSPTSALESERFGFAIGSLLPGLHPQFLDTPNGQRYRERGLGSADAVVVAVTIALDGLVETREVKSDDGETAVTVVTQGPITVTAGGTTRSSFPRRVLMVQIDLGRSLQQIVPALEPMTATQVAFGNIEQGLVMPAFLVDDPVLPLVGFIENSDIVLLSGSVPGSPAVGFTTGSIPSSGVVFRATTATEPLLPISAGISDIDWAGVPAYADDRMEPLLGCSAFDTSGC